MKSIKYKCDMCGTEIPEDLHCDDESRRFRLPLLLFEEDETYLRPCGVDLCQKCANIISSKYYEIAKKHYKSGIRLIAMSED